MCAGTQPTIGSVTDLGVPLANTGTLTFLQINFNLLRTNCAPGLMLTAKCTSSVPGYTAVIYVSSVEPGIGLSALDGPIVGNSNVTPAIDSFYCSASTSSWINARAPYDQQTIYCVLQPIGESGLNNSS
jgi:hypothetical protein